MNQNSLGRLGEETACNFLKKKNYKILARNYIPKFIAGPVRGEIDIIAKKNGVIIFVEVKTLSRHSGGPYLPAEDKVNKQKQARILAAARAWLAENNYSDSQWQIDVITVELDSGEKKAKVYHIVDAFEDSR